jgi:cysteine desulfurase
LLAKALELSYDNLEEERAQISELKNIWRIDLPLVFLIVNGSKDGFYNMLNVLLPFQRRKAAMILFNLDMKGIAVS